MQSHIHHLLQAAASYIQRMVTLFWILPHIGAWFLLYNTLLLLDLSWLMLLIKFASLCTSRLLLIGQLLSVFYAMLRAQATMDFCFDLDHSHLRHTRILIMQEILRIVDPLEASVFI